MAKARKILALPPVTSVASNDAIIVEVVANSSVSTTSRISVNNFLNSARGYSGSQGISGYTGSQGAGVFLSNTQPSTNSQYLWFDSSNTEFLSIWFEDGQ